MTGNLLIEDEKIGEVDLKIIDESMGVIGGLLIANVNYVKYKTAIQDHYDSFGISNIHDFDYLIILDDVELKPAGGIGVTDSKDFDEIHVESGGHNPSTLNKLRQEQDKIL